MWSAWLASCASAAACRVEEEEEVLLLVEALVEAVVEAEGEAGGWCAAHLLGRVHPVRVEVEHGQRLGALV